jgi:hypothetical protein
VAVTQRRGTRSHVGWCIESRDGQVSSGVGSVDFDVEYTWNGGTTINGVQSAERETITVTASNSTR